MERANTARGQVGKLTLNLTSSLVMATVAAVVTSLAVLSFAWFASSGQVDANSMMVSVEDKVFELGVSDPLDSGVSYKDALSSNYSLGTAETSGASTGIATALTPEVDEPLSPGAAGTFQFYIKPVSDGGSFDVTFGLVLSGIEEVVTGETTTYQAMGSESLIQQYLKGHILFFEQRTADAGYEGSYKYSGWISPESGYTFSSSSFSGRTVLKPGTEEVDRYEVTLYWVWPRTYSQMVLADGDAALSDRALFPAVSPDRTAIIAYINAHPEEFFQSVDTTAGKSLLQLSDGYNRADQAIGDTVRYLVSEIRVESSGT